MKSNDELIGNWTSEELQKKELAHELTWVGNEQLEQIPEWLISETAREEWKRLVGEFGKQSMISNLDYNNLGAYCNAFSKYLEITRELEEDDVLIGTQINQLVNVQLKYAEEMRRFGSHLGLTLQARAKNGKNLLNQQGEQLKDDFGDIG